VTDPTAHPDVRGELRALARRARMAGIGQKQARGLTLADLHRVACVAARPRVDRRGQVEPQDLAFLRGAQDVALLYVSFDALLRRSEAARLVWADVEASADGSGRLTVLRSKSRTVEPVQICYVSTGTMAALGELRRQVRRRWPGQDPDQGAPLFHHLDDRTQALTSGSIGRRIRAACQAAGLGDGYSSHSCRVGMAQALAAAGEELPALMTAGGWQSHTMPATYTRAELAGRGAVARFYARQAGDYEQRSLL